MKRLAVSLVALFALGLTACGFPSTDGQVHIGHAAHVEICPPYCGGHR